MDRVSESVILGVTITDRLSFDSHIDRICIKANQLNRSITYGYLYARSLSMLCHPPITTTARYPYLVHALICSRIGYGNAVYIGVSSTNTSKLQSILNAAARS